MQGTDNSWYLSHDFLGREAAAGSVFLDYRNSSFFTDDVSIIYGHRMNSNLMFSDVARYRDAEYFAQHDSGLLTLRNGKKYQLQAIGFQRISVDDKLYRELHLSNKGAGIIVLSTCDRSEHEKRDVLILRKVQ